MKFDNLHQILRSLYEQMMPLCGDMAGVAKGIAGLGALFYVAYRVWQSLARAEPIDVFPMLRPFAIGLCIMFFPTVVLGTINSILSPVVQGTAKMLEAETLDMNRYREQKDKLEYEAMVRNPETAYLVSNEEFDKQLEELGWSPSDMVTMAGMYIDRGMYNMKKSIRDFFREHFRSDWQSVLLPVHSFRAYFPYCTDMYDIYSTDSHIFPIFRQQTILQSISRIAENVSPSMPKHHRLLQ